MELDHLLDFEQHLQHARKTTSSSSTYEHTADRKCLTELFGDLVSDYIIILDFQTLNSVRQRFVLALLEHFPWRDEVKLDQALCVAGSHVLWWDDDLVEVLF